MIDPAMEGGERIGAWRLERVLGEGGMGTVYAARHAETGRRAALKCLSAITPTGRQALRRELRALSRLRHPGIVAVIEHGLSGGQPWYAMELVDGVPLSALRSTVASAPTAEIDESSNMSEESPQDAEPASALRRLRIVRGLCTPLAFLHGEGLVHGDIKPDNVMVALDDRPVLADFGLAARFGGRVDLDVERFAGTAMGTIAYMAPETLSTHAVDARADLYALGCMIYWAAASRPPFLGTPASIARAHVCADPQPLHSLAPWVSAGLSELAAELLAKDPRDRPGHALDVGRRMEAAGIASAHASIGPTPRVQLYRPRLAGRDDVVALLEARLDETVAGRGSVVWLRGASGIGKTRVASEMLSRAAGRGLVRLVGRGSPGLARPLSTLDGMFRGVADHCAALVPSEVDTLLGEDGATLAEQFPDLRHLVNARPPADTDASARNRLFRAIDTVLRRLATTKPLVIVLDDLQWADAQTARWLAALLATRAVAEHPIFLMGTCRDEAPTELAPVLASPSATTVRLDHLEVEHVGEIATDMLAIASPPGALQEFLSRHGGGNPFRVADALRAAVMREALVRDDRGSWSVREDRLPRVDSPRALVAQRLVSLPAASRALVDAIAVLGDGVHRRVVAEVAGVHAGYHDVLDDLVRTDVLEEPRPGVLSFVHAELREAAHELLDAERLARLHAAAAAALERRCRTETDRDRAAGQLARHWQLAGHARTAVEWERRAATYAVRVDAPAIALDHLDRARAIADTVDDLTLRVDVRIDRLGPTAATGGLAHETMVATLDEALTLANALGDGSRRWRILCRVAGASYARGSYRTALEVTRNARAAATAANDVRCAAVAAIVAAAAAQQLGDLDFLLDGNPPMLDWIARERLDDDLMGFGYPPTLALLGTLGFARCVRSGDAGRPVLERALADAEAMDNRYGVAAVSYWSSGAEALLGNGERALALGRRAVAVAAEGYLAGPELMGRICEGVALAMCGNPRAAIEILRRAIDVSDRIPYLPCRTDAWCGIARAHLLLRDAEAADEASQQGLAFAATTGEEKLLPELHRLRARAALLRGDTTAACDHLRTAIGAAHSRRAVVLELRARLELAIAAGDHHAGRDANESLLALGIRP